MSDKEDLELQALQRQLDDAFETTRPRVGFEDELWSRMQARRPFWYWARDFFRGLASSVREAPRVPATAVAVVLVVAIGVGILSFSGFHLGGGGTTSGAGAALRDQSGGSARYNAAPGGFGPLPAPALSPVAALDTGPTKAVSPSQPVADVYLGPATLTWAGQLDIQIASAPVYRYKEPTTLDKDRFATALGASPQNIRTSGALREYPGNGFGLAIAGSSSFPLGEPFFVIASDGSKLPPPATSPADAAMAFLSAHSLVPNWPYVVSVDQSTDPARVNYLRQFSIPNYRLVYLVNATGERHGLTVDIKNGQWQQAHGPLPLTLESADYPIISAEQAVRNALVSKPSELPGFEPVPTVSLTSAELVYALAYAGDHSFYEPAFLFSGTFTRNGATFVKRVLVPAVGPQ